MIVGLFPNRAAASERITLFRYEGGVAFQAFQALRIVAKRRRSVAEPPLGHGLQKFDAGPRIFARPDGFAENVGGFLPAAGSVLRQLNSHYRGRE